MSRTWVIVCLVVGLSVACKSGKKKAGFPAPTDIRPYKRKPPSAADCKRAKALAVVAAEHAKAMRLEQAVEAFAEAERRCSRSGVRRKLVALLETLVTVADRTGLEHRALLLRRALALLSPSPKRQQAMLAARKRLTGGPTTKVLMPSPRLEIKPRPKESINRTAFSPSGTLLAVARGKVVSLVDTRTWQTTKALAAQPSKARAVAFDAHGRLLATTHGNASVKLWNAKSGKLAATLTPGKKARATKIHKLQDLAFSPDKRTLAAGGMYGLLLLWDVRTKTVIRVLQTASDLKKSVLALAFSRDGRKLYAGTYEGNIDVWDVPSGRRQKSLTGHKGHVKNLAVSTDGRLLASACSGEAVQLWNLRAGGQGQPLKGQKKAVYSLSFSPDGARLATAGGASRAAVLWDVKTRRRLTTVTDHAEAKLVAFGPDGRTLITANHSLQIRDAKTLAFLRVLGGGSKVPRRVAFQPGGHLLAVGTDSGTVQLWDMRTGKPTLALEQHGEVNGLAFSPDGKLIAAGDDAHAMSLWDVRTGRLIRRAPERKIKGSSGATKLAIGPKGKLVATTGSAVLELKNLKTGALVRAIPFKERQWCGNPRFSPDGRLLATRCDDGFVKLWDTATGELLHKLKGPGHVLGPHAFSPDGRLLVIGSGFDAKLRLWDVNKKAVLADVKPDTSYRNYSRAMALAFHPRGHLLAMGCSRGEVLLWDLKRRRVLRHLSGHTKGVKSVAFSADGRLLASVGADRTVRLWDVNAATRFSDQYDSRVGVGYPHAIRFSDDGRRIVSASSMNNLVTFDVATGKKLRSVRYHPKDTRYAAVSFSPGAKLLATQHDGGRVLLWDTTRGKQLRTLSKKIQFGTAIGGERDSVLSPGGDQMVYVWGRTILLYALRGELKKLKVGTQAHDIKAVAYAPDGRHFATAAYKVLLFDAVTRKARVTFTNHPHPIRALTFSPDGHTLATGGDGWSVKLWDVKKLRFISKLRGHKKPVRHLAYSPSGRYLASASLVAPKGASTMEIRVWDTRTGRQRHRFVTSSMSVIAMAFSPNERLLAVSTGSNYELWELERTDALATLTSTVWGGWIVHTPDHFFDASPNARDLVRWRVGKQTRVHSFAWKQRHVPGLFRRLVRGDRAYRFSRLRELLWWVATTPAK